MFGRVWCHHLFLTKLVMKKMRLILSEALIELFPKVTRIILVLFDLVFFF